METQQDRPAHLETRVEIDTDLHAVAEWMQLNVPATRLVATASQLAALAPLLWGHYKAESIDALRLCSRSISEPRRPVASSE